jgi:mannose-1-phosphate guanylyltransferase
MKAIILVGGEGTRLRPLTYSVVKSMVPVLNRPFLEHVLCNLAKHNINEIVLAMGYKPDSIYEYFKSGPVRDIRLTYSLEVTPLGTAGAVKLAGDHVHQTFFVLNGDVFSDIDYTDMLRYHRENHARATIALTHVEDPTKFGVVETDDDGRVQRFIEKPPADLVTSHWINAGVYILEPDVLDYIPTGEFYMFERGVFPELLARGERVFGYRSKAYWIDMGTPAKYHQLNADVLQGKCLSCLCSEKTLTVGEGSSVDPTCVITGPVLIGNNCKLEKEARINGPAILGNGCRLKQGSFIENSVLWNDITIGSQASVINSIIASGANIEDKSRLKDQTYNHEAPTGNGGK